MKPPAASPGIALRGPRLAAVDKTRSRSEIREARAASRRNAFRGLNNVISLSLRFGLRSIGAFGWREPGVLSCREARGASRGNAFRGSNNVISLSLRFRLQSIGGFACSRRAGNTPLDCLQPKRERLSVPKTIARVSRGFVPTRVSCGQAGFASQIFSSLWSSQAAPPQQAVEKDRRKKNAE